MEIFRYLKYTLVAFLVLFPVVALVMANRLNFPIGLQTKQVSADGGNCEDADYGSIEGDEDEVEYEVGEGEIITGVCIKSGSNMFDGGHSEILDNGDYEEDGCYTVTGVGTNEIEVERNWEGPFCQGISHIDIYIDELDPTDTPDPDESETPDPTDTPDPDESGDPTSTPEGRDTQSDPTPTPTPEETSTPSPTPTETATSTPTATSSSSDGGTNSSGTGGATVSDTQGQVLGLSDTNGAYGISQTIALLLGIIASGNGFTLITKKVLSSKKI